MTGPAKVLQNFSTLLEEFAFEEFVWQKKREKLARASP
jgi:hypothetical protein